MKYAWLPLAKDNYNGRWQASDAIHIISVDMYNGIAHISMGGEVLLNLFELGYEICSGISTPCNILGLVVDAGLSVDFSHLECLTSSSVKLAI